MKRKGGGGGRKGGKGEESERSGGDVGRRGEVVCLDLWGWNCA